MYTAQGILLCNASTGVISTKSDKEKMQTSFWNRIEQFNDISTTEQVVQEPVQEPVQEHKKIKIVH
jgi:hypothetical protein